MGAVATITGVLGDVDRRVRANRATHGALKTQPRRRCWTTRCRYTVDLTIFPASRENTGNFGYFACWGQQMVPNIGKITMPYERIPGALEQGNVGSHQGIELGVVQFSTKLIAPPSRAAANNSVNPLAACSLCQFEERLFTAAPCGVPGSRLPPSAVRGRRPCRGSRASPR